MKRYILLTLFSLCSLKSFAEEKSRYEKLELFSKVLHLIESRYYRHTDIEKLMQGAIKGMISTLDPHSNFLNSKFFKKITENTKGEFGGIGIEVSLKAGQLFVIAAIEDTPAHKAGIQSGDRIVEINHRSTVGMNLEEAVDIMRGKSGSEITIGIMRKGLQKVKNYTVKREIIQIKSVKTELIDDHYLYLRLTQFQKRSAESLVKALKKAQKRDLKGIVLDLRNNPGGLLDEAIKVASIFLNGGIVVSIEERNAKKKDIRYVLKEGRKYLETPIIVLINSSSASASEIVAGALQDHKRAVIMGTRSFGKGSVQTIAKIDDTQGVKLTVAQYKTPNGRKIQAVGIKPDILSSEYEGRYDEEMAQEIHQIRETSLKNYLTAVIETKEEEKQRLARDIAMKKQRAKKHEEKERKDMKTDSSPEKRHPKEDFQIVLAVKHLKSFELVKKMLEQ